MNRSNSHANVGIVAAIVIAALLGASARRAIAGKPARLDYNRDVRPLLAANCFACHGPDKNAVEAGLQLDVRELALKVSDSGNAAIVPGSASESELVRRIFAEDADERMPPAASHKSLTVPQRKLLKRWIDEGAEYAPHWAFVPPKRPEPPAVRQADWPRNAIDYFILARLEYEGLAPSPEADRMTLIRRVTLDLTGLPPTPEAVEAFLKDAEPNAYERLVDRLMASRDYAERRAQDWLDLARYAETRGFADDKPRDIWPYREWVIDALHRNQPFDQFTIEQLAGDMLPNATDAQRIATGFHRNAPQAKGQTYPVEEYRLKGVADRVNTTGTVWLGLTTGCAECHDHKFDPISHVDYYRLFALFNSVEHSGANYAQGGPHLTLETTAKEKLSVPVMKELAVPRDTFVHLRGNFLTHGAKVAPGVPRLFGIQESDQPANRLEFARWLVNGQNPLVARVVVNRFWQSYFGRGVVRTPADFGRQGELPTHPELLDWLATEFVASGWDMKALNELIVTSATYRQSARRPDSAVGDPRNLWIGWMPRVRLPAEQIRDQALAVSGLLKPSATGRPFFPPQPDNYWEDRDLPGKWTPSSGDEIFRKSLYIYWRRMALHPSLELLDAPSRVVCTAQRNSSILPTQALVTLNDPIFVAASRKLAERILKAESDDESRLRYAFQLVLGRPPEAEEQSRMMTFLSEHPQDESRRWFSIATVLMNLDETLTRP